MKTSHKILSLAYLPLFIGRIILRKIGLKKYRLRVLIFHDIPPESHNRFKSKLIWLNKSWKFIGPEEFNLIMSGGKKLDCDSLLLTFDDGFFSNRLIAENVLNPMGIKALFFIVTNFVKLADLKSARNFISTKIQPGVHVNKLPANLINMRVDDIEFLKNCGHTIGAHTANHARLSEINENCLEDEVVKGADELEGILGVKIKHFAYTFGDLSSISPSALNLASKRFEYIYTGLRGNNDFSTPKWSIRRDAIEVSDSNWLVGAFLEGAADVIYKKSIKMHEYWGRKIGLV